MVRQRNWLPQGGRRALAAGTRVEDVAAELAYLHSRYPSMRTRLVFEGCDAGAPSGAVRQWVASSGETVLEIYDAGAGRDPDGVAAAVEAVYRRRPYDLRAEWPVRMAVVRVGDVCTHLVVIMHHLALDAGGAAVMMREVAGRETAAPVGMQPLEQAAWQASEAGRRQNDRVLRYAAQVLDTLPAASGPGGGGVPQRLAPRAGAGRSGPVWMRRFRHWSGQLVSPVVGDAVAEIGARTGVDESTVLVAMTGIAFGRVAGTGYVLMRPRVGNRFRPALADVVCFVAQSGLLVLDLAGTSFDEAVGRARGAMLAATKNAYADPEALQALIDRAAGDRLAVFYNDRRSASGLAAGKAEAVTRRWREQPREVRGPSAFTWLRSRPEPAEPLSITLDAVGDALGVAVHFDTRVVAPERAEALAWEVERAAVEAAADGGASTGV